MAVMTLILRKTFGVLAVFIGSSIIIWVLYNRLIEKQPQFQWEWYQGFGIAIPIIAVGIYWLRRSSSKRSTDDRTTI